MRPTPKILVVDDEKLIVMVLERLLRDRFDVRVTHDPLEALALIDSEPFDLILTDLWMPGATGMDILQRAQSREGAAAVVLMSGQDDPEVEARRAAEAGAAGFLSKPLPGRAKLGDYLERLIEARQAGR